MIGIAIAVLVVALISTTACLVVSRRRAREDKRRFQILGRIAAASDGGGALPETLEAICDILVPGFADFCMIDVIADGEISRVAVRVADEDGAEGERTEEIARRLSDRHPSLPERMIEDNGQASLVPRFFERMSEADLREIARDREDFEFLKSIGVGSAITVALKARGQVTGALTIGVAWSGRRYQSDHVDFASVLAGRVALALDNSGLFADLERAERARAEIAETLQRGLLPPPLPHISGWSVAAMYRPAGAENEVGGDFYDAFPIAGGWMLVIGDVTGRGARAASITAQARYTLRTAAVLTGDPLVALSTLNRALLARYDSALCSVAALALPERSSRPLRLAVAGHPPPLLIDDDGTVSEAAKAGPVLGAFPDASWSIERVDIRKGQQVVMITDGITEACGPDGRFGEGRLHAELVGATSPVLAVQRLEGALHAFTEGKLDDDAAILAVAPVAADVGADLPFSSLAPASGTAVWGEAND